MIRNWRHGALVAVAVLALAASNGCCCRTKKGIVLRGDWSLELNRVPHMQSNGPSYSGDCCAPACGVPCGCADGCRHGGAMSGGYEVLDSSGYSGGAGGAGGGGHGAGGAGGYGAEGGVPMPPPPQPTPAAQSRFHPIPTRPAFEPQGLAWEGAPATEPAAAPERPAPSARRGGPRLAAARSSPVRRTSAEFESEVPADYGDAPTVDDGHLTAATVTAPPVAPTREPAPTTSTWRVKSRQS